MWDDDLEKTRALNELNELNTEKSNNTNNEEKIDEIVDETEFGIEEKEALLYYLSIKAINVNRMTYSAALKRYINDFIDIEKYKGKSLTLEKK